MQRDTVSDVIHPSDWLSYDLSDRDQILNVYSQVADARPTWIFFFLQKKKRLVQTFRGCKGCSQG